MHLSNLLLNHYLIENVFTKYLIGLFTGGDRIHTEL
jgi:hypothetical protein